MRAGRNRSYTVAISTSEGRKVRVAVIGASGFVGRYVVDALLAAGHRPTLLVRSDSRNKLQPAGECRIVEGEPTSPRAVEDTIRDCDAVIFLVGILREFPGRGITFEALQYEAAALAVDTAARLDVRRFLLMSANGVHRPGTPYQETKLRAEEHARASGLAVTVFRPSVIFGDPRGATEIATQLYRDMVAPPLPAISFHTGLRPASGQVRMSPVHVADVADAFVRALGDASTIGRTFVLGGPEDLTWAEMLRRVAAAAGKSKVILPMPIALMRIAATLFDRLPFFPVTRDQLTMLAEGNSAAADDLRELLGRKPRGFTPVELGYLRR